MPELTSSERNSLGLALMARLAVLYVDVGDPAVRVEIDDLVSIIHKLDLEIPDPLDEPYPA